jgi:hypothetical protein
MNSSIRICSHDVATAIRSDRHGVEIFYLLARHRQRACNYNVGIDHKFPSHWPGVLPCVGEMCHIWLVYLIQTSAAHVAHDAKYMKKTALTSNIVCSSLGIQTIGINAITREIKNRS